MRTGVLTRISTGDDGTFGEILTDSGHFCICGELPWRDNQRNLSCTLPGDFLVVWLYSPKHKKFCFHVEGEQGRDAVEIHAANLMGDVTKGYVSQLQGCMAPGKATAIFKAGEHPAGKIDQKGVTSSGDALAALEADLGTNPWRLTVRWANLP